MAIFITEFQAKSDEIRLKGILRNDNLWKYNGHKPLYISNIAIKYMKQKFLEILGKLDKTKTIPEDSTYLFDLFENSSRYIQKDLIYTRGSE